MTGPSQPGMDPGREALRRFLVGEDDLTTMYTRIAFVAVETLPGCDMASITTVRGTRRATVAFTAKAALALDEAQYRLGDGPCLAAIRRRGVEHVSTAHSRRWPEFAAAAAGQGVLATCSVALGNAEEVVGALNLYSRTQVGYSAQAREAACAFADQLGIAVARVTLYEESYELSQQLREALRSRAVIEQAKGVLMAAQHCSPDAAFHILVRASQNGNRKLRDVAADVVDGYTRRDPTARPAPSASPSVAR